MISSCVQKEKFGDKTGCKSFVIAFDVML